jgi:alkylated DNA repair dioxygenase AlkB
MSVPVPKMVIKLKDTLFLANGNLNRRFIPEEYFLEDLNVAIIPDFMTKYNIPMTPDTIWQSIISLEHYNDTDELILDEIPKLLPGSHPALNYRGNTVARTKIWLQTDIEKGMKRYGYTGWQWRVSLAQKPIECMPAINELTNSINWLMPQGMKWNHVIGTVYNNGSDNIGFHSDKDRDFNPNTGFMVLKMGAPRRFQFSTSSGTIIYDKSLEPGTAVLVGGDANKATKHAVPVDLKCQEASGSLVWRSIEKTIPWSTVKSKIASADYK